MAETVVDRVARHPALNLKVIIVGAGVGGLLSALECWRKGCDVVVLEKNKDISLLGMYTPAVHLIDININLMELFPQATSLPCHRLASRHFTYILPWTSNTKRTSMTAPSASGPQRANV